MAERIAEGRCVEVAAGGHTTAGPAYRAETDLLLDQGFAVVWRAPKARHPPVVRIP
jgi:hypothetical protein